MLLGAVGAYDWNGTVVMHTAGGTVVPGKDEFFDQETEVGYERLAGYIGESTCDILKAKNRHLLVKYREDCGADLTLG